MTGHACIIIFEVIIIIWTIPYTFPVIKIIAFAGKTFKFGRPFAGKTI